MDRKIQVMERGPNYQRMYRDFIEQKFPHKLNDCQKILEKECVNSIDIILLERIIFGYNIENCDMASQKYRSYDKESILRILSLQKTENLNNSEVSRLYRISRNTIAKWRKLYSTT